MSRNMLTQKYATTVNTLLYLLFTKHIEPIVSLMKLTEIKDFLKLIFHSLNVTKYLL